MCDSFLAYNDQNYTRYPTFFSIFMLDVDENHPEAEELLTSAMRKLEKGGNGNEQYNLQSTVIQWFKKIVKSVVEAFENLLNSLDAKNKEGICCMSSGLCVTLDIQEDLFEMRDIWQKHER